MAWFVIDLF